MTSGHMVKYFAGDKENDDAPRRSWSWCSSTTQLKQRQPPPGGLPAWRPWESTAPPVEIKRQSLHGELIRNGELVIVAEYAVMDQTAPFLISPTSIDGVFSAIAIFFFWPSDDAHFFITPTEARFNSIAITHLKLPKIRWSCRVVMMMMMN